MRKMANKDVDVDGILQPNMQNTAPSDVSGSVVLCGKCGVLAPVGTTNCRACGQFLVANQANLRHGLRAYQTRGVLPPDLKVDIDGFRAAVIADMGGLEELPAVRAGLVRLLVDCEVGKRLWMNEVIRRGVDSRPGKAAYDRLLSTMDRWLRIALALGIERRSRQVMTLDQITDRFRRPVDDDQTPQHVPVVMDDGVLEAEIDRAPDASLATDNGILAAPVPDAAPATTPEPTAPDAEYARHDTNPAIQADADVSLAQRIASARSVCLWGSR